MISALVMAASLAQTCDMPKPVKHRAHHKAHATLPLQSCAAPPVPMCFREPAPEPDLLPLQAPLIYYVPSALNQTEPQAPDSAAIGAESSGFSNSEYGAYAVGGGGFIGTYSLPTTAPVFIPPEPRSIARAPEIDPRGGLESALVLGLALHILNSWRARR